MNVASKVVGRKKPFDSYPLPLLEPYTDLRGLLEGVVKHEVEGFNQGQQAQQTLRQLKIENVRLEGQHALIKGHLSDYTLHLGSAGVHRQPGGSLCILPVHAQHNGRIFLPFADSDPRTAEVISRVLLWAKDREIKDPTILEQLI